MNHKLDTEAQVFFYEQEFYVLSNFSAFTLRWKGDRFDTVEVAYHWEKFQGQPHIQKIIQEAASSHEAFGFARLFSHRVRKDWEQVRVPIMKQLLIAKVQQHEYVRRKLMETGTRELVEDSWRDSFWGWGSNRDGKNVLGNLWMEVRSEIQQGILA